MRVISKAAFSVIVVVENFGVIKLKTSFSELQLFWREVDNWYESNHVVTEFVRFNLNKNYKGYSGHLLSTLNTVMGKLTTFNEIWDNFKPKVRNNYRKAEKNKLNFGFFKKYLNFLYLLLLLRARL